MTARFMLDTDICIHVLSRRSPDVLSRFDRLKAGEAVISTIAYGELAFGASKSRAPEVAREHLKALTAVAAVEPVPAQAAEHYAQIRESLENKGTPIGGNDLWIAAHAKAAGLVLVTNNEREYRRVGGLEVQNWAK